MQAVVKHELLRIGIDASNISGGGGVTHLVELLRVADPSINGFAQIVLWGGHSTLSQVADRPWLVKIHLTVLDKGLLLRSYWQRFKLSKLARAENCDVLLVPGGSYAGSFHPAVMYSRNLLPFELQELFRFGWSWMSFKLILLRLIQSKTIRKADAVIFLTKYARDVVMRVVKKSSGKFVIVPHGVDDQFRQYPREQLSIDQYSIDNPFRIIYISEIAPYKHQWHVAEAVLKLRSQGFPVSLDLVGGAKSLSFERLSKTINQFDPNSKSNCVRYLGKISYGQLHEHYKNSDLCLFASSCENMPNILLEGMASGLPMACSNRGPMPEVLGEGGVYFNPEKPLEIALALKQMIESPELRSRLAKISFEKSMGYSWRRCANETFEFINAVVDQNAAEKKS